MTPEQKILVRTSFSQLFPVAETAAELFYMRLFQLDPSLRALFKVDFHEQASKFIEMISLLVEDLEKPDGLASVLRELGARHARYGVQSRHYETVGIALLWAIEKGLGRAATPDLQAAWSEFYAMVSATMQSGVEDTV